MKSLFALSTLALAAFTAGCGAAPEGDGVSGGADGLTDVLSSGSTGTLSVTIATVGTTTGATAGSITPTAQDSARVYVFDRLTMPNCGSIVGRTGTWTARLLGATGELANSCVMDWTGTGAPVLSVLPRAAWSRAGQQIYADSPIVAPFAPPAAGALVDAAWQKLGKGMFVAAAADGLPVQATRSAAFVAVVDSSKEETATDEASGGTYEHGEIVGRIARTTTGTNGAVAVISTTALPRDINGVRQAAGGYYGYTSDTAFAIVRAVDAWRARTATGLTRRPLVVNLSLGWEGAKYIGSTLDPAVVASRYTATSVGNLPQRSVFAAVQYASCAGALVLASAGNRSEASNQVTTTTMTFPAAWETVAAPTAAQCDAFGLPATMNPAPSLTRSPRMIYAVGGVDGADKNLFNARTAGVPRLVAYGDSVVVSKAGGGHTGIMTGTSMAAGVASAAAAYAWSFAPKMSAHDLAQTMYDQSQDLRRLATACSYGVGVCGVRRISICAMAQKLSGLPGTCSTVPANTGSAVKAPVNPTALGIAFTAAANEGAAALASGSNSVVAPKVRPMPGSGGCSLCGVYGGTAYLDIANPSATLEASVSFDTGWGMSFSPDSTYMSLSGFGGGATSGTITFSDPFAGWTSTQQLFFF